MMIDIDEVLRFIENQQGHIKGYYKVKDDYIGCILNHLRKQKVNILHLERYNKFKDDKIEQLQSEIKELRDSQEWISVKDRLPELETMVVCYGLNTEDNALCGEVFYDLGEREQEGFSIEPYSLNGYTTHWKPLPKPPEEKQ